VPQLTANGGRAIGVTTDVTDFDAVDRLLARDDK
jgi:hypothetical protein